MSNLVYKNVDYYQLLSTLVASLQFGQKSGSNLLGQVQAHLKSVQRIGSGVKKASL
jgi:hypothetical protein